MRTEDFKHGMVSLLLVLGLVFSMVSVAPIASPGDLIYDPGGETISVVPGGTFLIRHTLEWNEPKDGAYAITLYWVNYDNDPSENFTFVEASAYFTTGPNAGESILAVVELGRAPAGTSTKHILSVSCPANQKDSRNGQFNVDIHMSASGVGGVPHIPGDHVIPWQLGGIIIVEDTLTSWNRDPVTIRVLPGLISISPNYQSGLPGTALEYTVTVTNVGENEDNFDLTVIDSENWGPTLDDYRFENILPGENRKTTLGLIIPENAVPWTEDIITVTATSHENVEVSDSVSCVARVQGPPSGIVSYWKFDEGSGSTAFDSVGGNHGTIYGATWTSGKINNALSFDGTNDYVKVSHHSSLDITKAITLEMWVKFDSLPQNYLTDIILSREADWQSVYSFVKNYADADDFAFVINDNAFVISNFFAMDTWYHIVGTYDGTTRKIYKNGALVGSDTTISGDINTSINPLYIGGGASGRYIDGIIDEVAIYNRALSKAEVLQHYLEGVEWWDASITITFSGGSDDAIFGVRPDATENFDNVYDIPEPPAPPEPPYVRTFFYYPEQTPGELHWSCLAPEDLMGWPLRIEYAEGLQDITLTWNMEDVPADYSVFLYREDNIVADMKAKENYTFEASTGSYDFRIVVGKLLPFTLELARGWNMISFPVLPSNPDLDSIFGGSYYVIYRWDAENKRYVLHADSGSFIEPDSDVEVGIGYWAYVLEDENVPLLGIPVNQLNLSLRQGWNLIGSPYVVSDIADPADDPDNSVISWAFTWNPREKGYSMTQLLEAGKGYWAYAVRDCTLTLLPTRGEELIVNGDFSTGDATGWMFGFAAEPPYGSEPSYEIINYTARIYRTGAGTTGRGAWLFQEPIAYVGDASELILSFSVKVDYHSLTSGDSNREFTADVIVRYVDVNGNLSVFKRGFFYVGPNTHENAENIPQSTWVQRSYDLASLSPKPATIQEVLLDANGWDYDVSFDDVSLIYVAA